MREFDLRNWLQVGRKAPGSNAVREARLLSFLSVLN